LTSESECPNIIALSKQYNKLSQWVPTLILLQDNLSSAKKCIKFFISLAEKFLDIHNYNSLMAISSGFSHFTLRKLIKNVKGMTLSRLHKIENLTSPLENFQNLRELYNKAVHPFIPPQVILSRDIVFIGDANKTWTDEDNSMLNVEKIILNGNLILKFITNKQYLYSIAKDGRIKELIMNIEVLEEEEFEKLAEKFSV